MSFEIKGWDRTKETLYDFNQRKILEKLQEMIK
jgi:hypothetical protein